MVSLKTLAFLPLWLAFSCSPGRPAATAVTPKPQQAAADLSTLKFTVEQAPEWSALFKRSSGWFGADGIFAIPQSGRETANPASQGETTFLFSDTVIGQIAGDSLPRGFSMVNNTVATLKGLQPEAENIRFHWDQKPDGKPAAVFVPQTPASKPGEYFWLGDGFVNQALGNATYLFAYRMRNVKGKGVFNFEEAGNVLIKIPAGSMPPYRDQQQMDTPFFIAADADRKGSLGAGIFVNTKEAGAPAPDGYVYVYGVQGSAKSLLVARVRPKDFERFDKWRFWDGAGWNQDIGRMRGVTDKVSNELSVSPLPDGRYALVFQVSTISPIIGMRIGSSPAGPFGPIIHLFDTSEALVGEKFFTYNAKAHPSLSGPGELLISYNVNSFDFLKDIKAHPNLYRPRFIRVKLQE